MNNSCGVRSRRERERGGHDYSPVRRDLAVVARAEGGLFVAAAAEGGRGEETEEERRLVYVSALL